ncbi:MAG: hypothetical protein IBX40_01205 [Methanosarcinales archaeon]|nr:hypothetical protein [Methanosarcinales archaeon]
MSSYREAVAKSLIIDDEIKELIKKEDRDFRICTSCSGPLLIPTDIVPSKPSDLEVEIGDNSLFISFNQARYTHRFHKSLLDQYYWVMEMGLECDID